MCHHDQNHVFYILCTCVHASVYIDISTSRNNIKHVTEGICCTKNDTRTTEKKMQVYTRKSSSRDMKYASLTPPQGCNRWIPLKGSSLPGLKIPPTPPKKKRTINKRPLNAVTRLGSYKCKSRQWIGCMEEFKVLSWIT